MWGMIAMAGLQIAGGLMQAGSQYSAAKANEEAMRREARYQKYKSILDEKRYIEQAKKQISEGNVAFAKNGIRSTSGTVQEVFRENTQTMLADAEMIRLQGNFAQNKALMAADNYGRQKDTALISGLFNTGSGVLGAMDRGGMFDKTTPKTTAAGNPSAPMSTKNGPLWRP
jgi:hypothetical protein